MMQAVTLVLAYALMLAGPLLQGLAGNTNPNAYIFAPVMLAGVIPQIAGQNIRPSPLTMLLTAFAVARSVLVTALPASSTATS